MVATVATAGGPAVLERLAHLEAENRRLRRAGVIIFVIVVIPLLMGQARPAGKVVECEQLILRDAGGRRRGEFSCAGGPPRLLLFDENGMCRLSLAVEADGSAGVLIHDAKGRVWTAIRVRADGEPQLGPDDATPQAPVRPAVVPPDAPSRPELLRRAEPIYRRFCQTCHGRDGRGTQVRDSMPTIPDFANARWQLARSDVQLLTSILSGQGTDMPPFDEKVTPAQARDLVAYIRAFAPGTWALSAGEPSGDFEARFRTLQRQWDELERQRHELMKPMR
jgi:mono/diheme cytochrome c family protein